jgi:hypothetical protein
MPRQLGSVLTALCCSSGNFIEGLLFSRSGFIHSRTRRDPMAPPNLRPKPHHTLLRATAPYPDRGDSRPRTQHPEGENFSEGQVGE